MPCSASRCPTTATTGTLASCAATMRRDRVSALAKRTPLTPMWAPKTAFNEELVLSRLIAFAFSHSLGQ